MDLLCRGQPHDCLHVESVGWPNSSGDILRCKQCFWHPVERASGADRRSVGAGRAQRKPRSLLRASATLTLLVGATLLLACLLRLGIVANFISEPVLVGFKAGIGLVIVVDQLPKIVGIHVRPTTRPESAKAGSDYFP
jgi:Sulfate permease family